jgi:hypothetical protein
MPEAPAAEDARRTDEQIADRYAEWKALVAGDGCRDEVVRGPGQQRHVAGAARQPRIGVDALPIFVAQSAVAQILDARAAAVEHRGERLRDV